jgi:hypothetical protein
MLLDLIPPDDPAWTAAASKQFEKRPGDQVLDSVMDAGGLAGMLAARLDDRHANIGV